MTDRGSRLRELYVSIDREFQEHGSDDQRRMLALLEGQLFGAGEAEP